MILEVLAALATQRPTDGPVETMAEFMGIVQHPAFRLGFLDAQRGRSFCHDRIMERIEAETPASALRRLAWPWPVSPPERAAEIAQYRYEEGRLAVIQLGLRCRSWEHPDFPPAQLMAYIRQRYHGGQR